MQDTLLDKMPDSMRKDVEKLLEDIPAMRKTPERFTRKEQAKQAVSGVPAGPAATAAGPTPTTAVPQEDEVSKLACNNPASASPCDFACCLILPCSARQGLQAKTWSWLHIKVRARLGVLPD